MNENGAARGDVRAIMSCAPLKSSEDGRATFPAE